MNQYRLTYEQFQQLAETGSPVTLLSTLEAASSVPIGKSEYDQRLELGQLGENLRQAGSSSSEETDDELAGSSSNLGGPVSRGVFGGFLGLLLGAGIAIAMEHLDRRLRTRDDVEDAYRVPVLADIPMLSKHQRAAEEVLSYTAPLSRTAEAHRAIRSALIFQHVTNQPPSPNGDGNEIASTAAFMTDDELGASDSLVVLITSALPNEGKTTTTANLAAVFAESGASVLAVNCDFRRPTLHRFLGAEHVPRKVQESNIPGVALVSGVVSDPAANPAQIIAAQRQVVATARERFDVILLDTAPLLTTNDAIEIVPVVDGVVIVARTGVTTVDGADRTRTLLERVVCTDHRCSARRRRIRLERRVLLLRTTERGRRLADQAGGEGGRSRGGRGCLHPAPTAVETDGGGAASEEDPTADAVVTWVSEERRRQDGGDCRGRRCRRRSQAHQGPETPKVPEVLMRGVAAMSGRNRRKACEIDPSGVPSAAH